MNFLTDLYGAIKAYLGRSSKWAQWIGALIVIDILGMWTYTCIQKQDMIPMDTSTQAIVLTVYVINGLRSNSTSKDPDKSSI